MRLALRKILFVLLLLGAAAVGGAVVGRAQAQSPPASPDVLSALLVEVRGLRAALEQMASAGPRVQLAFGRLQLQEQRIAEMSRKLDATRANLASSRQQADQHQQLVKAFEDGTLLREVADPAERRELENHVKAMKGEMLRVDRDIQRLQGEEASLLQDITAEQGRWTDINQRLEELERSLRR